MDGTRGRESGAAPTEIPTPQEELVIFVERLMHFMNVWTVYRDLLSGHYVPTVGAPSESDPFPNMTVTMMFLLYASFYSLIEEDEKSVNAFRVWRQHFPKEESAIAAVEAQRWPWQISGSATMYRPIMRLAIWCCLRFATVSTSSTIIAGSTPIGPQ
jgi:hypothetical protein